MLAKVVQPDHLLARLKVAETQARDVQIGEPASIDTHNGVIAGAVIRIDPAVQNGAESSCSGDDLEVFRESFWQRANQDW